MTPGARLAAAIEVLDHVVAGEPAERALTRWARRSRFAGSKDRAAVRDVVFDAMRRRRSALWASGSAHETGRALVIGAVASGATPEVLDHFGDGPYAPPVLSSVEQDALRALDEAPRAVQLDLPDFLLTAFEQGQVQDVDAVAKILRTRAPVDLRVNRLRATPAAARKSLAADGIEVEDVAGAPDALRVTANPRLVSQSAAYRAGLVELQDAASQSVAAAVAPKPGERILDLCAGGGGKTLALSAAMQGETVFAHDINPARMRDLPVRADRAGASVEMLDSTALSARFDAVLVDAPCSGSGAFRRNPDQKWRLTPESLTDLVAAQTDVIDRAMGLVVPGGRVIFATCSVLWSENEAQVAASLKRWPGARPGTVRRIAPGALGDGFFIAIIYA